MQLAEYLALVTSEHQNKPNYNSVLSLFIQPFVDVQAFLAGLPSAFDLDTAIGVQLDAVGVRVGLSRRIKTPLANLYFSWSDPVRGWGRGLWYNSLYGDEYGVTLLDDETYRTVLRAKIASNNWDGTLPGVRSILGVLFSGVVVGSDTSADESADFGSENPTFVIVQDDSTSATINTFFSWNDIEAGWAEGEWFVDGDTVASVNAVGLGITVGIAGKLPPLSLLFLLEQELVPVKSVGAPVRYAFTSVDDAPLFGWGVANQYINGWGIGAWGVDADTILNAPPGAVYPVMETA